MLRFDAKVFDSPMAFSKRCLLSKCLRRKAFVKVFIEQVSAESIFVLVAMVFIWQVSFPAVGQASMSFRCQFISWGAWLSQS